MKKKINVSIVLYYPDFDRVASDVSELRKSPWVHKIFLVDNTPVQDVRFRDLGVEYVVSGNNMGYGAGHNLALRKSIAAGIEYHLVMNEDVSFNYEILEAMAAKMDKEPDLGLMMPRILNEDGSDQILPKIMPAPVDLAIKVVKPLAILFNARCERYTLRKYLDREMDISNGSGCFSFIRVAALEKIGLYDESFFMYFEDNDLIRRMLAHYRALYFPSVSIVHSHGRGARKSPRLFRVFLSSACRYFMKYGWFFDSGRKAANRRVLEKLRNGVK